MTYLFEMYSALLCWHYCLCGHCDRLGPLSIDVIISCTERLKPRFQGSLCDEIEQIWSPIIDISTSRAQLEHFMVGKTLAVAITAAILLDPLLSSLPTTRRQAEAQSWSSELCSLRRYRIECFRTDRQIGVLDVCFGDSACK